MPNDFVLKDDLDYNKLCSLVSEGKTDEEIAEMYFVHRTTIQRMRQSWGIHKPKNPEKYNWGMIKRMLECNLTYDDIAHIYGDGTKPQHIIKYVSRKRKGEQQA